MFHKEIIMKKIFVILAAFLFLTSQAFAHSGRTDSRGGHNCSEASKRKGLCSGYHYHNSGSLHFDSTDEVVSINNISEIDMSLYLHRHPENNHGAVEAADSERNNHNSI